MANELTNITGIGGAAAASLMEAGFTTVEEVAKADPKALEKVKGFGPARAARTIATAKELTAEVTPANPGENTKSVEVKPETKPETKPEVKIIPAEVKTKEKTETKIDPIVAAAANRKFAALRRPGIFISTIVVIALAGVYTAYPDFLNTIDDALKSFGPSAITKEQVVAETASAADGEKTAGVAIASAAASAPMPVPVPVPMPVPVTIKKATVAAPVVSRPAEPEWVSKQRALAEKYRVQAQKRYAAAANLNEPEWVTRQRAEVEKYRLQSQKRFAAGLPPKEPDWITRQRAEMEKYRLESQKRFAAGLPPKEPEWVTKQRAEAKKYQVEAQKRYADFVKQNAIYVASRGYAAPYSTPNYTAVYGQKPTK